MPFAIRDFVDQIFFVFPPLTILLPPLVSEQIAGTYALNMIYCIQNWNKLFYLNFIWILHTLVYLVYNTCLFIQVSICCNYMYKKNVFLNSWTIWFTDGKRVNLSMDCKSENVIYCAICPLKNFKLGKRGN